MGAPKGRARSFVRPEYVDSWCKIMPTDSRFTFVCVGKRPSSKSMYHRVVAFHLRSVSGEPEPYKFAPENTHQFVISYHEPGSKVVSLFQGQINIPALEFATPDYGSRIIAGFLASLLTGCDEFLARDYGRKKAFLFGRRESEDMPPDYFERRYQFWSHAIAFRLEELIKTKGVR